MLLLVVLGQVTQTKVLIPGGLRALTLVLMDQERLLRVTLKKLTITHTHHVRTSHKTLAHGHIAKQMMFLSWYL